MNIHLQGGVYEIYTPSVGQSDWSECYNHDTSITIHYIHSQPRTQTYIPVGTGDFCYSVHVRLSHAGLCCTSLGDSDFCTFPII